jgi:secondary thiamine-phosphate synthase enzyme
MNCRLVKQHPLEIPPHQIIRPSADGKINSRRLSESMRDYCLGRCYFRAANPMRIHQERLGVRTNGKGTYEITHDIQAKIDECGVRDGTVTVFVQHTSCSVIIMENADPTARHDLEEFFDRLVPEDADYFTHGAEGSDDMPSHIRMVLTRTSETVPINNGKMQLGTWQGVFIFEHRRAPHRRKVSVMIIGE